MSNEIIESWEENAREWVNIIDSGKIASRKFTDPAIVSTLKASTGRKILDIGCGEGWLTRSISAMGKKGVGLDAIEPLLENARQKGPEPYYQISYEDIIAGHTVPHAPYDIVVFNFCLYWKKGIPELFTRVKKLLCKKGSIVIQTLHPYFLLNMNLTYKSQEISDSWNGLPGNFRNGHHWYARTFEDWFHVFAACNMKVIELKEVIDADGKPISLIVKLS